jgi:hypothetical protein
MIFDHMAFPARSFMLSVDLANHVARPQRHSARQRRTAILRGPDQLQRDVKNVWAPLRYSIHLKNSWRNS